MLASHYGVQRAAVAAATLLVAALAALCIATGAHATAAPSTSAAVLLEQQTGFRRQLRQSVVQGDRCREMVPGCSSEACNVRSISGRQQTVCFACLDGRNYALSSDGTRCGASLKARCRCRCLLLFLVLLVTHVHTHTTQCDQPLLPLLFCMTQTVHLAHTLTARPTVGAWHPACVCAARKATGAQAAASDPPQPRCHAAAD